MDFVRIFRGQWSKIHYVPIMEKWNDSSIPQIYYYKECRRFSNQELEKKLRHRLRKSGTVTEQEQELFCIDKRYSSMNQDVP